MKEENFLRKLQVTGGSTIIVSLPKSWVKGSGVNPGSYVSLKPQPDGSILIIPKSIGSKEALKETSINVASGMSVDEAIRKFVAYYLVGYELIRIKFSQGTIENKTTIKNILRRKFIGVEPISESADELVVQCIVGYKEIPLHTALTRMGVLTISMINDAMNALKNVDHKMALEVFDRDDEVDRLYFFTVRQLKKAVRETATLNEIGLPTARACLGYRMIIKSIERAADHAARIASLATTLKKPATEEIVKEMEKIKEISTATLKESLNLIFKFDFKKANQLISRVEDVKSLEENLISKILKQRLAADEIVTLRLAIESLKRIVEYSADIAETTINLTIEEPLT